MGRRLIVQRIDRKIIHFQLISPMIDHMENTRLFHAVVGFRIFFEITSGHPHELVGGAQTGTSGGPLGIFVHSEVHKTARQLNEGLIKVRIGLPARLQPQILQHIVGLIKIAGIEAFEVAEITRIMNSPCQMRDSFRNPPAFVRHSFTVL